MRTYTVPFASKAESAAIVDWVEIVPAANKPIEIVGFFIAQTSDFGDAQSEIIPYKVSRGWSTSGSGGSTVTPVPIDPNDSAAGFTVENMNTTVASAGTETIIANQAFNIMAGEQLWLPDGFGWQCLSSNNRLTIRPLTAPADALTFTGTVYVRELV